MREKRNAYRILVGKPEGKRRLGRPRRRCVDSIKMNLREIGCHGTDWIDLTQDRYQWRALVKTIMNLRVPNNVWNVLSSCTTSGFSRRAQFHEVSTIHGYDIVLTHTLLYFSFLKHAFDIETFPVKVVVVGF
jgi:hypothetical protein